MGLAVWQSIGRGEPSVAAGRGTWRVSPAGVCPADACAGPEGGAVLLAGGSGGIAALVTPEWLEGCIARNGQPLPAGVQVLRHGDRLDLGGLRVWVSATVAPVETAYDPALHGDEAFCARTRSRLRPGEPIVICPGTEAAPCQALYKAEAWALGRRCHQCGRDPRAAAWRPPVPEKENYRDLVRLALEPQLAD